MTTPMTCFRLPQPMLDALRVRARRERRSPSALVRTALALYLGSPAESSEGKGNAGVGEGRPASQPRFPRQAASR